MANLKKTVLVLVIPTILLLGGGCGFKTYSHYQKTEDMMGTFVSISVYAQDKETAESAIDAAFEEMSRIEAIATIYDEQSEASRLNRDGYLDKASPHILSIMKESKNYCQITDGAFDITIQPLLDLWGAGLWQEPEEIQQEKIEQTMKLIGSEKINISGDRIELEEKGMAVTLGGIAKGYAVDKAFEVLKQKGIKHALINAGGDIMTSGEKPDGSYWTIALENPDNNDEKIAVFKVAGKAVATSGNYERYFDPEKDVHHITDPRSGYSANMCISATIISNSCMDADALATSIFVLGPEQGLEMVNRLDGVEALIIDNDRNIYKSDGLGKYMEN